AHPRIRLTFAAGLRSFLRQDPDVIMVGEIRDTETAEVAIEAALTGHLVLSTLHTNDAVSSITRLIDMSIEPFLLASSLNAILAQRLVRKICPSCKIEDSIKAEEIDLFKRYNFDPYKIKVYKGTGCPACKNSGYKGRSGIYELLIVSDKIREMIMHRTSSHELQSQAKKEGLKTLIEDGLDKITQGVTTLEEIWRVTKEN
ncbi:MAG: Flp pilus assembly complex ATPase component TadA, partial [Armatimonadetes bacterium]|nr:Flp pilus assembly complex ATPase component TadA [Armatimonadota bacterium]